MSRLKAAVVGLGQAGSRFDEEPRGSIWSHVGAYLALPEEFQLVGGVDVNQDNLRAFSARCPSVPAYASVSELLLRESPDVVSIATPATVRREIVEVLFQSHLPKLVICEKPLAVDAEERRWIVDQFKLHGIPLLVHYNRRYSAIYQTLRAAMHDGLIGEVTSITIRCPNRMWSIGSHAFDLLFYLSGESPSAWRSLPLLMLEEGGEPSVDFLCTFPSGKIGRVAVQGKKAILIFEVDVVGTSGRLIVSDNGSRLMHIPFRKSRQYRGYQVAGKARRMPVTRHDSTFITVVRESAEVLRGEGQVTCSGEMALQSETMLDQLSNELRKDMMHE